MTSNKIITKPKKSIWFTYWKYVAISCLKRPYSYIGGICYLLFLAIVLLIIPAAMHSDPMFLWASSAYNTTVFNIIFIAISCSGLVIAIFKKDQIDDTDLNISAKPISKWKMVLAKLSIYLIFMVVIIALAIAVCSITFAFGLYSSTNPTGIRPEHYKSLLLSVLVGSLISFVLFGSIAIFISLKGPIVTTMIATSGIAILLSIFNLLISRFTPTPRTKLSNDFGLSINTYSLNTVSQYLNDGDSELLPFATIPSNEEKAFDTYEYWSKAVSSSKTEFLNYIDIGKQLSMLYQTFGMSDAQLNSVNHNEIGLSISYRYKINKNDGIKLNDNVLNKNYPIGCYLIKQEQGMNIPSLSIVGHQLSRTLSQNWLFLSEKIGFDFNSINFPSIQEKDWLVSPILIDRFNKKISYSMSDLLNNQEQHESALNMYEKALNLYKDSNDYQTSVYSSISNDESGAFFEKGKWNNASIIERYMIISKVQLDWYTIAQQRQIDNILSSNDKLSYPFNSSEVTEWYKNNASKPSDSFYIEQRFIENLYNDGIFVGNITSQTPLYCLMSTEQINCETFSNLYLFVTEQYFDTVSILAIYSSISVLLLVISTIVYKRRDIK